MRSVSCVSEISTQVHVLVLHVVVDLDYSATRSLLVGSCQARWRVDLRVRMLREEVTMKIVLAVRTSHIHQILDKLKQPATSDQAKTSV